MLDKETSHLINEGFDHAIRPAISIISGTLVPSESWRTQSIDIAANRFIFACRDFLCQLERVTSDKGSVSIDEELQSLLDLILLECNNVSAANSLDEDMMRSQKYGKNPKLTTLTMNNAKRIMKNTIKQIENVENLIHDNTDEPITIKLCSQLAWVKISILGSTLGTSEKFNDISNGNGYNQNGSYNHR